VILALVAKEDQEVEQIDYVTAFLNREANKDIYVELLTSSSKGDTYVCKLNKALYSLKQASRL
jgi:hypothetical protein